MKKTLAVLAVACLVAFAASPSQAQGAGPINPTTAKFTAPTTNTDGSPLTDLASYNLYVAPSSGSTCPAVTTLAAPWAKVASLPSATTTPAPNTQVTMALPQQTDGQKCATVSAVDQAGNESTGAPAVSFFVDRLKPAPPSGVIVGP